MICGMGTNLQRKMDAALKQCMPMEVIFAITCAYGCRDWRRHSFQNSQFDFQKYYQKPRAHWVKPFPLIVDRFPNCFPQMMAATMDDMQAMSMSPDTKVQQ